MSKYNITIISDRKGEMALEEPKPNVVANTIVTLLRFADSVERIYRLIEAGFNDENDFYIMLADIESIIDEVDEDNVNNVQRILALMGVYSKNSRWINSTFAEFNGVPNDEDSKSESVYQKIKDIVVDGEIIGDDRLELIKVSVYNFLSAVYQEVYNTYDLDQFTNEVSEVSLTMGFNEAATVMKKKPEDIASGLYDKMQEFIFVSNEVDRDPEISKVIRGQIPEHMLLDFEDIIELITKEQVENIINGKIRINTEISCRKFIDMVSNSEYDE